MIERVELDCAAVDELAAAHGLGAVDAAEAEAIERHLASCGEPHTDAHGLIAAATVLPEALEPVTPSPELRGRLMATIAATPQEHRPIQVRPVQAEPSRVIEVEPRRPWWRVAPLATGLAAVALAAAVGFGAWGVSLNRQIAERDAALQAVASANAIHAASGSAGSGWVIESGGEAMFMAEDLAELPSDQLYEMWLIGPDGTPTAVGTLTDTEGVALVPLDEALGDAVTFAVTVEAERVEAPTGDPVVVAALDA
jgi:anti-sigma-K factor RskA